MLISLLLRVPARCFRQDYTRRRTQFRPEVSLPVSVSLSVCGEVGARAVQELLPHPPAGSRNPRWVKRVWVTLFVSVGRLLV